eukprot:TRINITY_DN28389_c0_g1_i1.p1 TRINITY_DN28389_c0_g1~~TRINITY_DN28389_c0_g1_i1.p1  ORF type:complete len:150 (+),score=10.26 TRINITY_DN28389_c0_g1_i1:171-620(+)
MHFTQFFEHETRVASAGARHTIAAAQACATCTSVMMVAFAPTKRYITHFFSCFCGLQTCALLPHALMPASYSGFKMEKMCMFVVVNSLASLLSAAEFFLCDYLVLIGGHIWSDTIFSVATSIAFVPSLSLLFLPFSSSPPSFVHDLTFW